MKLHLPKVLQRLVLATSIMSWSVGAETLDHGNAPAELVHNVAGQLVGFDSLASEALLLVVFILLVLAVIVHNPKAP